MNVVEAKKILGLQNNNIDEQTLSQAYQSKCHEYDGKKALLEKSDSEKRLNRLEISQIMLEKAQLYKAYVKLVAKNCPQNINIKVRLQYQENFEELVISNKRNLLSVQLDESLKQLYGEVAELAISQEDLMLNDVSKAQLLEWILKLKSVIRVHVPDGFFNDNTLRELYGHQIRNENNFENQEYFLQVTLFSGPYFDEYKTIELINYKVLEDFLSKFSSRHKIITKMEILDYRLPFVYAEKILEILIKYPIASFQVKGKNKINNNSYRDIFTPEQNATLKQHMEEVKNGRFKAIESIPLSTTNTVNKPLLNNNANDVLHDDIVEVIAPIKNVTKENKLSVKLPITKPINNDFNIKVSVVKEKKDEVKIEDQNMVTNFKVDKIEVENNNTINNKDKFKKYLENTNTQLVDLMSKLNNSKRKVKLEEKVIKLIDKSTQIIDQFNDPKPDLLAELKQKKAGNFESIDKMKESLVTMSKSDIIALFNHTLDIHLVKMSKVQNDRVKFLPDFLANENERLFNNKAESQVKKKKVVKPIMTPLYDMQLKAKGESSHKTSKNTKKEAHSKTKKNKTTKPSVKK